MTTALQDTYNDKTTLTLTEAYNYEKEKGRIRDLSFDGFRTRVDNGHYPSYKPPGSKERLIDVIDIEEMYLRLRNKAKKRCFKVIE